MSRIHAKRTATHGTPARRPVVRPEEAAVRVSHSGAAPLPGGAVQVVEPSGNDKDRGGETAASPTGSTPGEQPVLEKLLSKVRARTAGDGERGPLSNPSLDLETRSLIRYWQACRNVSDAQLAGVLGCSTRAVRMVLDGQRGVGVEELQRLQGCVVSPSPPSPTHHDLSSTTDDAFTKWARMNAPQLLEGMRVLEERNRQSRWNDNLDLYDRSIGIEGGEHHDPIVAFDKVVTYAWAKDTVWLDAFIESMIPKLTGSEAAELLASKRWTDNLRLPHQDLLMPTPSGSAVPVCLQMAKMDLLSPLSKHLRYRRNLHVCLRQPPHTLLSVISSGPYRQKRCPIHKAVVQHKEIDCSLPQDQCPPSHFERHTPMPLRCGQCELGHAWQCPACRALNEDCPDCAALSPRTHDIRFEVTGQACRLGLLVPLAQMFLMPFASRVWVHHADIATMSEEHQERLTIFQRRTGSRTFGSAKAYISPDTDQPTGQYLTAPTKGLELVLYAPDLKDDADTAEYPWRRRLPPSQQLGWQRVAKIEMRVEPEKCEIDASPPNLVSRLLPLFESVAVADLAHASSDKLVAPLLASARSWGVHPTKTATIQTLENKLRPGRLPPKSLNLKELILLRLLSLEPRANEPGSLLSSFGGDADGDGDTDERRRRPLLKGLRGKHRHQIESMAQALWERLYDELERAAAATDIDLAAIVARHAHRLQSEVDAAFQKAAPPPPTAEVSRAMLEASSPWQPAPKPASSNR